MKRMLLMLIMLKSFTVITAQTYIEGGKTRHRFAQLNLGADTRTFLSQGSATSFINSENKLIKRPLDNYVETRLKIGGTHFWGHSDFEIAIPVAALAEKNFKTAIETGVKIFPLRIEKNKLRGYFGINWLPVKYKQDGGTELIRNKFPLTAGAVYNYKNNLIELGLGYNFNNNINYYISKEKQIPVKLHAFWISAGIKYSIETTLSAEKNWMSGKTKLITETLGDEGKLDGLTVAAGVSSALFLKKSTYNVDKLPFIDNHKISRVFPELGVGYYFHTPDIQVNLSYRNIKSSLSAFGHNQTVQRNSMTLEAYKFITDYHGFAAFVGAGISNEKLSLKENNPDGNVISTKKSLVKPGIVFGWDIRPNRLQTWYLRTNLRWFPGLNIDVESGKIFSFDQLEINFIQLVILPGRLKFT